MPKILKEYLSLGCESADARLIAKPYSQFFESIDFEFFFRGPYLIDINLRTTGIKPAAGLLTLSPYKDDQNVRCPS